ncbi:MAG: SpoIIE family protein phosphatase [Flavobacteriales bacterium]|nr:SpoIIE family protein phosphatase [Flavobacteriales bacterium]
MKAILSRYKLQIVLIGILILGGVILLAVSQSIKQKELEKKILKLVTAQGEAINKIKGAVNSLAIIASGMGTYLKLADRQPTEEQFQQFLIQQLRELEYTDSVFVSFVDTNMEFIYAFNKTQTDPANLKGKSVKQFRGGDDLINLYGIMEKESILMFDPFNLIEGWAGLPINFGVRRNGKPIGFVAIIVDVSQIIGPLYKDESNEFLYHFRTSTGMDFDCQSVKDGSIIYNATVDTNYYGNFDVSLSEYLYQDFEVYDLKLTIGTAFKRNDSKFSWFDFVAFIWYGSLILFTSVIVNQIRKQKLLNQRLGIAKDQIEEKNNEIVDSINYAKRIQDAILPSDEYFKKHLPNSFVFYQPKDIVAGDFYWLETVGSKIIVAAADCTGHGVPGAMLSVVCDNALNRACKEFRLTSPATILDKVKELVVETFETATYDVQDGMDIALCVIDKEGGILEFAGANNPLWLIRKGVNEVEQIKGDKQPIGKYISSKKFTNRSIKVENGDSIFLFSDGYADQFGGLKGKKLKYKKVKELLLKNINEPMEMQKFLLKTYFDNWKREYEQVDDICVIGVKL